MGDRWVHAGAHKGGHRKMKAAILAGGLGTRLSVNILLFDDFFEFFLPFQNPIFTGPRKAIAKPFSGILNFRGHPPRKRV